MNNISKYKSKNGDITLLVTLLVCSMILILLTPLAQKVSVESKISRENLMSQQAVQAAKTGLERWVYDVAMSTTPFNVNISTTKIFELNPALGIQYKVDFQPKVGSNPAYIISTGIVTRGDITIERVLEEKFAPIKTTPTTMPRNNQALFSSTSQPTAWQVATNVSNLNIADDNDGSAFPTNFYPAISVVDRGGSWIANNSNGTNGPLVTWTQFVFRQTFDLTEIDPKKVQLKFRWAADDSGNGGDQGSWRPKYRINNSPLIEATWPGANTYELGNEITVNSSSGLISGKNTIDFYVQGNGVTDGMALEVVEITVNP